MIGNKNPNAWNNWYHAIGTTRGTWLQGDSRGFRVYHHRYHVNANYRHPLAPGEYEGLYVYSQKSLKNPPIILNKTCRKIVCDSMISQLLESHVEVISLGVAENHFHLLARFPELSQEQIKKMKHTVINDGRDPAGRYFVGLAKRYASYVLGKRNMKPSGKLWAIRTAFKPIKNRSHQIKTFEYIMKHKNAEKWNLKMTIPQKHSFF